VSFGMTDDDPFRQAVSTPAELAVRVRRTIAELAVMAEQLPHCGEDCALDDLLDDAIATLGMLMAGLREHQEHPHDDD
jgi:hypothetical protein